jgi:hypothetical protein
MAAAEARAAWQRAANRCVAQEDRKRAPKLACCPLPSEQQHGTNHGNCTTSEDRPISNFVPLSCNPINPNLPQDIRWWLHLQPNFGIQKDLASDQRYLLDRDIDEKEVEDSAKESKHEEPFLCETVYTNPENSEDVFGFPWMISTDFGKNVSEINSEELKIIDGYFEVPLKGRGNLSASHCLCENKKFLDFKSSGPPPLKNQLKADFATDTSCKEGEKAQPWWQITDENELASLVAERAMQNIENCDLPRPAQTVHVHGTKSHEQENMVDCAGSSSPRGRVSHSYPGKFKNIRSSYSSTDELDLSNDGVWQQHERNNAYRFVFLTPKYYYFSLSVLKFRRFTSHHFPLDTTSRISTEKTGTNPSRFTK